MAEHDYQKDAIQRKPLIAAALRSARAAKHISQRQFARDLGVDPTTVSSWEKTGCISAGHTWAVADYYGISIDDLINGRIQSIVADTAA